MDEEYCIECKKNTQVIFDHAAGDCICFECGLVLEAHSIDDTSEWRTFANESGDNDPNRVGASSNPLLTNQSLVTIISKPNGASGDFLSTRSNHGSNSDRSLLIAIKAVGVMSDRLGLVKTIRDRASEYYKRLEDQKCVKGRKQDPIYAACLFIACHKEAKPRTVKEIQSITNGTKKKEIGRAIEYVKRQLGEEMGPSMEIGAVHDQSYLKRFGSHLSMSFQAVKAAQEAVAKIEELDIRRSPTSVAAAVLFMITQLSEKKKSRRDISLATGVAEGTIRNSVKDLLSYASRIIPNWYAKEEDLKKLSAS
ncbi:hypothetical protein GIB67_015897 [Kingdonia uniflora]|uniref:TFIIB-type domain-containing protein n=1 Tax=Kingdonia uniflora TaxID=39325 RepID=A0A7J7P703_9MAGN|nr:hypothetical protein GIB67_015896 [Kingdonia uniflora]KAF6175212.1 hypothetical protein GIB67_015897 [Kingdonia uniflora]